MDGATIAMFVFQTVITAIIGIASWGVKNAISEIKTAISKLEKTDKENAEEIAKVHDELNALKADPLGRDFAHSPRRTLHRCGPRLCPQGCSKIRASDPIYQDRLAKGLVKPSVGAQNMQLKEGAKLSVGDRKSVV